jgi:hypothetical protein
MDTNETDIVRKYPQYSFLLSDYFISILKKLDKTLIFLMVVFFNDFERDVGGMVIKK